MESTRVPSVEFFVGASSEVRATSVARAVPPAGVVPAVSVVGAVRWWHGHLGNRRRPRHRVGNHGRNTPSHPRSYLWRRSFFVRWWWWSLLFFVSLVGIRATGHHGEGGGITRIFVRGTALFCVLCGSSRLQRRICNEDGKGFYCGSTMRCNFNNRQQQQQQYNRWQHETDGNTTNQQPTSNVQPSRVFTTT